MELKLNIQAKNIARDLNATTTRVEASSLKAPRISGITMMNDKRVYRKSTSKVVFFSNAFFFNTSRIPLISPYASTSNTQVMSLFPFKIINLCDFITLLMKNQVEVFIRKISQYSKK